VTAKANLKVKNIQQVMIEDEMKNSYLDYAMSVIIGRALPDVRDGLKPVHRRILYAMHDMGLYYNKPHKKCARIVGEVLGKYHPHGDMAVYDALTRMAQDFNLRYPLIDGHGNYGSVDGDKAAAMRYTEARLTRLSHELLQDIEKETVNFRPNFDDSLKEPEVLPAKIPNLLLNGSEGIAVGMATKIPPHNLCELIDGIVALIDEPGLITQELMDYIPGPDFPTGAMICGRSGIIQAYRTGKGVIVIRARIEEEEYANKKTRLVVTEIPYQVSKTKIIEDIVKLVKEKKIEGISDIRDESNREGIRLVIELKKGVDSRILINKLYKYTSLQTSFGIIMLTIVNGVPQILNLKGILNEFISYRQEIIRKRTEYDLKKARERAHILEGYLKALSDIDKVISLIKSSKTVPIAKERLIKEIGLTEIQAQAVLDMKLQRLTSLETEKLKDEYKKIMEAIKDYEDILKDPERVKNIIKEELQGIKKTFGDKRRTEITSDIEEHDITDFLKDEQFVITVSHSGYIKRQLLSTYKVQHRGGKGKIGMGTKEEDFTEHLFIASTFDYILFFTDKGKVYWLKVYEIPEGTRQGKGKPIVNLIKVDRKEKITAMVPVSKLDSNKSLYMCTRKGIVKRTLLSAYANPRRTGIIAVKLDENDSLVSVKKDDGNKKEVFIATKFGKAIRFRKDDVRIMGRVTRGVIGIRLTPKDEVVGMELMENEKETILSVTENGYGKRSEVDKYRLQTRGGSGVINMKITPKNGYVCDIAVVKDDDEIIIITMQGRLIRIPASSISVIGRATQGVKVIDIYEEDKVTAFEILMEKA